MMQMIHQKLNLLRDQMTPKLALKLGALVLLIGVAVYLLFLRGGSTTPERIVKVTAKRVVNGHYVKLKDDEKLNYLGIRAPYEHEPLFNQSTQRNEELVVGKELRLRYDDKLHDRKGRLWAYAFLEDGTFVNQVLVVEGLAYVRARPNVVRFRDSLIAAQKAARKARRGLWAEPTPAPEPEYFADPKYAEFHRPSCETAMNIKPERLTKFTSRDQALDLGFSPCDKCLP